MVPDVTGNRRIAPARCLLYINPLNSTVVKSPLFSGLPLLMPAGKTGLPGLFDLLLAFQAERVKPLLALLPTLLAQFLIILLRVFFWLVHSFLLYQLEGVKSNLELSTVRLVSKFTTMATMPQRMRT